MTSLRRAALTLLSVLALLSLSACKDDTSNLAKAQKPPTGSAASATSIPTDIPTTTDPMKAISGDRLTQAVSLDDGALYLRPDRESTGSAGFTPAPKLGPQTAPEAIDYLKSADLVFFHHTSAFDIKGPIAVRAEITLGSGAAQSDPTAAPDASKLRGAHGWVVFYKYSSFGSCPNHSFSSNPSASPTSKTGAENASTWHVMLIDDALQNVSIYDGAATGHCPNLSATPTITRAQQHYLHEWKEVSRSGNQVVIAYTLTCQSVVEVDGIGGRPQTLDIVTTSAWGPILCPGGEEKRDTYRLVDPNAPIGHHPFGLAGIDEEHRL